MPYKSRWSLDIPRCSLPTLLFGESPTKPVSDPDKVCFAEAGRPDTHYFTRGTFRSWCQRLALGLSRSKHFKPGDRVLLFSGNDLFFPVAFMGVIMAGGVFTGANPTYTARELAHQLMNSEATYLLCSEAVLDTGLDAARISGMAHDRVYLFDDRVFDGSGVSKGHIEHWSQLFMTEAQSEDYQWPNLRARDECDTTLALNYSSGTTGVSKGVEVSHLNYVANTLQFAHLASLHKDYQGKTARAKWLCYLPLYHAMAQNIHIAGAFLRSKCCYRISHSKVSIGTNDIFLDSEIPVYIMPRFDFLQTLEYIQKFKITELQLVPPIAVALAKHPAVKTFDLSSIEAVGCGSAPLGRDVSIQVEKLWPRGKINMKQGWGMTEFVPFDEPYSIES